MLKEGEEIKTTISNQACLSEYSGNNVTKLVGAFVSTIININ